MRTVRAGFRLSSACLGRVPLALTFLVVSVLWVTAGSGAPGAESTPTVREKRAISAERLPGGMNPMDVMRIVKRNRELMQRRHATVKKRPEYAAALDEVSGYEQSHTGVGRTRGSERFDPWRSEVCLGHSSLGAATPARQYGTGDSRAPADGVGAAFQIGREPMSGLAAFTQNEPSIAFDGTNYLVVWEDSRTNLYSEIYGARISADGSVLDTVGIAISTGANGMYEPAVAFDGASYLVVWEDWRGDSYLDIYGARVSVGGSVLDPVAIPISTAPDDQRFPAIAFDGTHYVVVWEDRRSGSSWDIYGARVNSGGGVLDPAGIAISAAANDQSQPTVAFDGVNYLAVWSDGRAGSFSDIYGARISVEGVVLDLGGIAISSGANYQSRPVVAFGGTQYLVAWEDKRRSYYSDVFGARVSMGANVLDPEGIAISIAGGDQLSPSVGFDGTNYLVAWGDGRSGVSNDIYAARVSAGGSVLDPAGFVLSTATADAQNPAIVFGGTNYLVVWQDGRSGSYYSDVYGTRASPGGVVLDPAGIAISRAANSQYLPAIAFDGSNYLVVWVDWLSGPYCGIYGARVSADGVVLDPTGIPIAATTSDVWRPSVAFGGVNYLVVWEDLRSGSYSHIYGARVSTEGIVLDPAGIAISTAADDQWSPAVAFDGTNYLVVWDEWHSGSFSDIHGARVSVEGGVLDPAGIAISTAVDDQYYPATVFDGTNYFVVWTDYRTGGSDIYGARVSAQGSVLDPAGVAISTASASQWCPAIAFDGVNYLVVWEDGRGIYGARVSMEGGVLDPAGIAVCTEGDYQYWPCVAFDGTNYVVVWADFSTGSSCDIYGARVTPEGDVVDQEGLVISTAARDQIIPTVSRGPGCTALITYMSFMPPPYGSYRIWGNIWHGPTAIAFVAASATAEQGHVRLSWQTAVEAVGSSFVIERSEAPDAGFVPLDLPISMHSPLSFSCTDYSVFPGKTYWYKIVLAGSSGSERYGPIEVHVVAALPTVYAVYQSYPNPFNPLCTIRYDMPRASRVSLRVLDVSSAIVRTVVDGWREAGVYTETWDGRSNDGNVLPSGVYLYYLKAADFVAVRKMVLVR